MTVSSRPPQARPAPTRPERRRLLESRGRAPLVALVLGAVAVAVGAAIVGVRVTTYALDETLFKASAVHYTQDLPNSIVHDLTARATSRLYALTLAPIYGAFDGDRALQLAKVWNAILFASAAIPAYLLARLAIRSRWRAVAAALLCVATPWLTLTSALYTEALAYPVAIWVAWAAAAAVRRPHWRRDLLVLALCALAVVSRVQLAAMLGGYVAMVIGLAVADAHAAAPAGARLRAVAARLRAFPFSMAVIGLALLAVLWMATQHTLGREINQLVGSYGEFQDRTILATDSPLAALTELVSLALGVGVVPVIVALAWYPVAVRDRADRGTRAVAATAIAMTLAVWAFAIAAQNGFIGDATEERYFIYAVPFAWVAAFAALERPRVGATAIGWSGALMAVLFGAVALPYAFRPELFLAPAGKTVAHLEARVIGEIQSALDRGGLTGRDLLFAVGAVLAVALAVAWRPAPWLRRWLVGGAAVFQVAITVYAMLAVDGRVAGGAVSRTGAPSLQARAWIDHAPGRGDVTIVRNALWSDFNAVIGPLRDFEFYNNDVRWRAGIGWIGLPYEQAPVDALPLFDETPQAADGRLEPGLPAGRALAWTDSPHFQLVGRVLASAPGNGDWKLYDVGTRPRLEWLSVGLRGDGAVQAGPGARVAAWPRRGGALVRFTVMPPPAGQGEVRIRLGATTRTVALRAGAAPVTVSVPVCGPARGRIQALRSSRQQDGARIAALVPAVHLSPAGGDCPS